MDAILKRAFTFYGLKEIPGEEDNPTILNFFAEIGQHWVQDDETAWCSAFINYLAKVEGYEYTGKLNARSWLDIGIETDPFPGCIVVLWRVSPDSWKGHVGLYINQDDNYVYVLGGNQSNQVKVTAYPKERLLSYRMLEKR